MVTYIDPVKGRKLVFLTNLMELQATTICRLYMNRWPIESLFRQIKQNFELNYFPSDSPEGIKMQIWVAMTLNLIFTVIHKMIKEAEDFRTMVRLAAKNTASKISFIKFLKLSNAQVSACLDDLGNMQFDLFSPGTLTEYQNSS